jgi:hypothetical protein
MSYLFRFLLLSALFVIPFTQNAQHLGDSGDLCYVVNLSGDTLLGQQLAYRDPILQTPYFELDTSRIEWNGVRFLRNDHGVFANVSSLHKGEERYAMRVHSGSVSVLERVEMDIYGDERLPERLAEGEEGLYLAKGRMDYLMTSSGELHLPNYRSMINVFGDSPQAMEHVKRFRTYQWIKRGLAYGGGAILAASFLAMTGGFVMSPQLVIGMVMSGGSFFLNAPMNDSRWLAVDAYNR